MCKELERQMSEMLKGSKPTVTTKAITILSMDLDRKFGEVNKNLEDVNEKLDTILDAVVNHKKDIDFQLTKIREDKEINCKAHKAEIDKKMKNIEFINFFSENKWLMKLIGVMVLITVLALLGFNLAETYGFIKSIK